jgi:hypothetical protein
VTTHADFTLGDRVRIVGGEHDGRTGTIIRRWGGLDLVLNVNAEAGETTPTGGRTYCRGGRGGFTAALDTFTLAHIEPHRVDVLEEKKS